METLMRSFFAHVAPLVAMGDVPPGDDSGTRKVFRVLWIEIPSDFWTRAG
jgi:hypothetical protein